MVHIFPRTLKKLCIHIYTYTRTYTRSYICILYKYIRTQCVHNRNYSYAFIPSRKTGCAKILSPIMRRRPDTGCFRFSPPRVYPMKLSTQTYIHTQKKNRGRRSRRYIYIYLYIVYYNNVLCIAMVQELYTGR